MKHVFQFVFAVVVLALTVGVGAKATFAYDSVTYTTSDGKNTCVIGVSADSTGLYATWHTDADGMQSVSFEVTGSYEFQDKIAVLKAGTFRVDTNARQSDDREAVLLGGGAKSVGYIRDLNKKLIDDAVAGT